MRERFGWILFGLGVLSILFGGVPVAVMLGFACSLAGDEFCAMAKAKGINPSTRIVRGMVIAFFVVAGIPAVPGFNLPWNWAIEHFPLLLSVGIVISFFRLLFRHESPPATIADIATTILGFIYVGWLPSHLVLLRNLILPGSEHMLNPLEQPGLAYAWATAFIIWGTDVFAYYVGKKFGKHLLYPQISPKKTIEGAIGGLIAAVILTVGVFWASDSFIFATKPFHGQLWQAPFMACAVSVAGQLGDLCESLLKRDAGLKDSSNLIPGHGGILDRGDSLIFASAVAYYYVCICLLGIL